MHGAFAEMNMIAGMKHLQRLKRLQDCRLNWTDRKTAEINILANGCTSISTCARHKQDNDDAPDWTELRMITLLLSKFHQDKRSHQVHVSKEIVRPLSRVHKVLAVIICLSTEGCPQTQVSVPDSWSCTPSGTPARHVVASVLVHPSRLTLSKGCFLTCRNKYHHFYDAWQCLDNI